MLASFPGFLFSFFSCLHAKKFVEYNNQIQNSLLALESKKTVFSFLKLHTSKFFWCFRLYSNYYKENREPGDEASQTHGLYADWNYC